jgi:hypothetical protein
MQCDKCNGLMNKESADEYRCLLCSKRKYVTAPVAVATVKPPMERNGDFSLDQVHAHPLVKAVADLPPPPPPMAPWRCEFILAIRGTRCKSDRTKDSIYCKRHKDGQPALRPDPIDEPRDPEPEAKEPMPPTKPIAIPAVLPNDDFLPEQLKFVVSREAKDWGRFAGAWSLTFPRYELGSVHDGDRICVYLRLKKEPQT